MYALNSEFGIQPRFCVGPCTLAGMDDKKEYNIEYSKLYKALKPLDKTRWVHMSRDTEGRLMITVYKPGKSQVFDVNAEILNA